MKSLDFSQFHALDHWPWQCEGAYGGWRHHLRLWWDYQGSEELWAIPHSLLCRACRHQWVEWWSGMERIDQEPDGWLCHWCAKARP